VNEAAGTPLSGGARRLITRLKGTKTRVRERLVLVEGVRAVASALDAEVRCRLAVTSPRLLRTDEGRSLAERLDRLSLDVRRTGDRELDAAGDTDTPQGVLLVCAEPETDIDALPTGIWLVLDAVQDPGNLGTLVRAAVAFGCQAVLALDGTTDPWGTKAVRASAGHVFHIPVARANVETFLARARAARLRLLVADAEGPDVAACSRARPLALVVGNEGRGAREEVREAADALLSVPMRGPAESLNVGVAGAILLYALTRET